MRRLFIAATLSATLALPIARLDAQDAPSDVANVRVAPAALARTAPRVVRPEDHGALTRAFAAADAGRWSEAFSHANGHALASKILRWLDLQRPGAGYAFEEIVAFLNANPTWPLPELLLRRAEEMSTALADDRAVIAWFAGRKPLTPSGALRLAEAHDRIGARAAALAVLQPAWHTMTLGEQLEQDILNRLGHLLVADDHWRRVDQSIWNRRFNEAQRLMPRIEPGRRLLAEARMRVAREGPDAPDWVKRVPERYAGDAGLAYERVRYNRRAGFDGTALAILREQRADLGRPDLWWRERELLVRRLVRDGQAREAYALARDHGMRPEHGQHYVDAEFLAGFIALRRQNNHATALAHFERINQAGRTPVTRARGAFWSGRAAEASGDLEEARRFYERAAAFSGTYYGQLALLRLPSDARSEPTGPPAPSREERAAFDRQEVQRAARLLADLDDPRLKHFVRRLAEIATTPTEHRLASQFALALGRPDLAVSTAKRSAQLAAVVVVDEGWPVIATPPGGTPEPALVLATIRQESAFEADAISRAGARGLMQLMPATARMVAAKLGVTDHSLPRLTADPGYNMRLGQAYLAGLLGDYGGSYLLSMAAYNAGPGRAAQWIRENGDPRDTTVDPIDWVELITIEETRNYVQRVMENLVVYRRNLGNRQWLVAMDRELGRSVR